MTRFGNPGLGHATGGNAPPEPEPWAHRLLKKVCVVQLDTDQSLQGVLVEELPDALILRAAKLLDKDADTPLAGEQIIPRTRIVWVQVDEPALPRELQSHD